MLLLADESGKVGRIVVSNRAGEQELSQANQAVRVERSDAAPAAPFVMDEVERKRLFGAVLDTLPTAEVHFSLYFKLGGNDLTAESEGLLPEILRTVEARRSTTVAISGHTDTTGDAKANFELGLSRAQWVAAFLRSKGLGIENLVVASHGEADLLVQTPDNTAEPRNRRVEVVVW